MRIRGAAELVAFNSFLCVFIQNYHCARASGREQQVYSGRIKRGRTAASASDLVHAPKPQPRTTSFFVRASLL